MGLIPDRWLDYSPVGAQIEGSRFIAFKVPLDNLDINATETAQGDDVDINNLITTKIMYERIPNLGLVIDLTNTKKYYNPKNVTNLGIEYKKIFVPGQKLPGRHIYEEFMSTVTDFLRRNAENDKLIGVHCTHGLNRTGLMICAHMIQINNIPPMDAIARFESARGHKMERENYVASLRNMTQSMQSTTESCSSAEIVVHGNGNLRTISTQTNSGVWLETKTPKTRSKRQFVADEVDEVKKIKGTVLVDGRNLISDDRGNHYMRVELNEVRPIRSNAYSSNRNYVPYRTNMEPNPSGSYYTNPSVSSHSSYRPSPHDTLFSKQPRYSNDRFDRRNADYNTRTFGQSFQQQQYFNEDLFK